LVDAIDPTKTHFIQISTDMVFSGRADDPGPYAEDHPPEGERTKLTWYGFTKAEAERIITGKLGREATILRIIYPVRAKFDRKSDYLRGPLARYRGKNLYPLFTDQQVSITFTDEACEALAKIISGRKKGIFHAGSRDTTTPYELISYCISKIEGKSVELKSGPLGELEGRYAKYGGLKVEETQRKLGITFSTWREIVDKLISQGMGK
jgi:dTDP-4-dehydrorhamnose reductase